MRMVLEWSYTETYIDFLHKAHIDETEAKLSKFLRFQQRHIDWERIVNYKTEITRQPKLLILNQKATLHYINVFEKQQYEKQSTSTIGEKREQLSTLIRNQTKIINYYSKQERCSKRRLEIQKQILEKLLSNYDLLTEELRNRSPRTDKIAYRLKTMLRDTNDSMTPFPRFLKRLFLKACRIAILLLIRVKLALWTIKNRNNPDKHPNISLYLGNKETERSISEAREAQGTLDDTLASNSVSQPAPQQYKVPQFIKVELSDAQLRGLFSDDNPLEYIAMVLYYCGHNAATLRKTAEIHPQFAQHINEILTSDTGVIFELFTLEKLHANHIEPQVYHQYASLIESITHPSSVTPGLQRELTKLKAHHPNIARNTFIAQLQVLCQFYGLEVRPDGDGQEPTFGLNPEIPLEQTHLEHLENQMRFLRQESKVTQSFLATEITSIAPNIRDIMAGKQRDRENTMAVINQNRAKFNQLSYLFLKPHAIDNIEPPIPDLLSNQSGTIEYRITDYALMRQKLVNNCLTSIVNHAEEYPELQITEDLRELSAPLQPQELDAKIEQGLKYWLNDNIEIIPPVILENPAELNRRQEQGISRD